MKRLKSVVPALATASAPLPALAQASVDRPTYWHSRWDWGWGHMFFGSRMMILFWGGLILVILFAVRWMGGGSSQGGSPPVRRPLDILQEGFAWGEIDQEEFEKRRSLLSDSECHFATKRRLTKRYFSSSQPLRFTVNTADKPGRGDEYAPAS